MIEQEYETRKKAIFDTMGARGQKSILKKGYADWDPFIAPKDPIDIRKDQTKRTARQLMQEFFQFNSKDKCSDEYSRGVFDICSGLINNQDRYMGMFEFSCWYRDLLIKETGGF